jgi:two-component system chemotaxis response regulator CheY
MNPNTKIKILVVDDDHIMCELLKSILRREGYDVVGEAHNGEEALEQCAKLDPHVVCLDINMPKMGGLEALHALKVEHPKVVVIMVSAEATIDVVREAMSKGACGFIVKPYNAAKILDTLNRCTGQRSVS